MPEQVLKFKAGQPIVIATAEGAIYIYRESSRELRFVLPPGLTAFKGEDRALRNKPTKFALKETDDGDRNSGSEPVAELADPSSSDGREPDHHLQAS